MKYLVKVFTDEFGTNLLYSVTFQTKKEADDFAFRASYGQAEKQHVTISKTNYYDI